MAGVRGRACLAWALGLVVLSSAVLVCSAQKPRVRKELRQLTKWELNLYVKALTTMINMPQDQGEAQYGPAYREYDYFIVKHAVSVLDPRGDQGHFGPSFMTFHRALLLEFEASVLSIAPQLKAIPYWDVLMDVRGGPYPRTHPKYMYTSAYAGELTAAPENGYQAQGGIFAWRQIPQFNWDRYGQYAYIYNGSLSTGLLRGPRTNTQQPYVVRYPASPVYPDPRTGAKMCYYTDGRYNEFTPKYSTKDWQLCLNPRVIQTHMDWHWCIDMNGFEASPASTPGIEQTILSTCSSILHPAPHYLTGGQNPDGGPGDFNELATSPNEVLLFMLHHANIDRNYMIWQKAAATLNPYLANQDILWFYPADPSQFQYMRNPFVDGCYLHDTINSAMPFTDIFPYQPPENPDGYTHADVLWYTRPGASPYVYDNMGTGRGQKTKIK